MSSQSDELPSSMSTMPLSLMSSQPFTSLPTRLANPPQAAPTPKGTSTTRSSHHRVDPPVPTKNCVRCRKFFPLTLQNFSQNSHGHFQKMCVHCNHYERQRYYTVIKPAREKLLAANALAEISASPPADGPSTGSQPQTIPTSFCTKCWVAFPRTVEHFMENRNGSLTKMCRNCLIRERVYHRISYQAKVGQEIQKKQPQLAPAAGTVSCNRCRKILPKTTEHFRRFSRGVFTKMCKECLAVERLRKRTLKAKKNRKALEQAGSGEFEDPAEEYLHDLGDKTHEMGNTMGQMGDEMHQLADGEKNGYGKMSIDFLLN